MSGLASDGMPLEAAQPAIRGLVTARPGATGRAARLARNLVLVLLAVVVLAAGVLLAVPQWRAAVLPSGSITYTASAPAAWRAPETAPAAALPLDDLDATAAPA